jgi:hypothetical protein
MIRAATGILAALVLVAAPASAEYVIGVESGFGTGNTNLDGDPVSITQNVDTGTITDMVACGNQPVDCTPNGVNGCTTENAWGRLYNLDDAHSINDALAIQSVDIAHLIAFKETGEDITLELNLYTLNEPDALAYAALTSIGQTVVAVPGDDSASNTFQNVAVAGLVDDPNVKDLFVEQFAPEDGTVAPLISYRSGGNGAGEFADSYLASASCGLPDLTPFAGIGFGNIHLIQVVNGKLEGGSTPTQEASWSEIKSLYQ